MRPLSLRRRLLLWLIVPLGIMAVALVTEAYLSARASTEKVHDELLVATALGISEHVVGTDGDLVPSEIMALLATSTNEKTYYLITGPDNAFLTGFSDLPLPPGDQQAEGGIPLFYNAVYQGQNMRMVALRFLVAERSINGWMEIHVAKTTGNRKAFILDAVTRSATRILIVVALAVVFAWVAIGRGLAPLETLRGAITRRSFHDLRPITHEMPDEVEDLVIALNQLLNRLRKSIDGSQQFIADASHQLRTPLSALQAQTEIALQKSASDEERVVLGNLLTETQKASRLANQLLSLAKAGPQAMVETEFQTTDLTELAKRVTESWVRRSIDHKVDLGMDAGDATVVIEGNSTLLEEMLSNLIDNALRYRSANAIVTVRVAWDDDDETTAVIEVEDNGPGIPTSYINRVTDRFVRVDERASEGCGLGLAIVREVAERHGGSIHLQPAASGGLLAKVRLARSI